MGLTFLAMGMCPLMYCNQNLIALCQSLYLFIYIYPSLFIYMYIYLYIYAHLLYRRQWISSNSLMFDLCIIWSAAICSCKPSHTKAFFAWCDTGTSMPDCFTSVFVARNGEVEMAVCNALGSNVFDVLLGTSHFWCQFASTLIKKEVASCKPILRYVRSIGSSAALCLGNLWKWTTTHSSGTSSSCSCTCLQSLFFPFSRFCGQCHFFFSSYVTTCTCCCFVAIYFLSLFALTHCSCLLLE